MGLIRVLDQALASQIAAGEVVERPASVVKELLENALDAGARHIEVVLQGGGIERLLVRDDGRGMDESDAALCFSRHATSKLRQIEDLRAIGTFGFRGEALGAIGSVARVSLRTRPPQAAAAHAVDIEGGQIQSTGEEGTGFGTTIDVRDLFYNVPARRKFLKTERTEAAYVERVVRTCALGQPGVAFRLKRISPERTRVVLDVPEAPDDADLAHPRRIERAVACLGKQVRDVLYPFEAETELLALTGYVVAPLETRRDLNGIHLSVNQRPVSDRGLVQAVRTAFRTLLEVGRQPICALDIAIDPHLVDVNVHPRKAEVRFAEPRRVHGHVIRLLAEFLSTTPWLQRSAPGGPTKTYVLGAAGRHPHPSTSAFHAGGAALGPEDGHEATQDPAAAHRDRVRAALLRFRARPPGSALGRLGTKAAQAHAPASRPEPSGLVHQPGLGGAQTFSAMRVIGQVGLTYLVLQSPDGMVLIDQHAAHERVRFEVLRGAARAGTVATQPLLFPVHVDLSPEEEAALNDAGAELAKFGIDATPFGPGRAVVRALPPSLDPGAAEPIVRDALAELSAQGSTHSLDERSDRLFAKLACHGSVRAGQALSDVEIRALLQSLDAIDLGAHCPHGRPVVRALPYTELASWFDRG